MQRRQLPPRFADRLADLARHGLGDFLAAGLDGGGPAMQMVGARRAGQASPGRQGGGGGRDSRRGVVGRADRHLGDHVARIGRVQVEQDIVAGGADGGPGNEMGKWLGHLRKLAELRGAASLRACPTGGRPGVAVCSGNRVCQRSVRDEIPCQFPVRGAV